MMPDYLVKMDIPGTMYFVDAYTYHVVVRLYEDHDTSPPTEENGHDDHEIATYQQGEWHFVVVEVSLEHLGYVVDRDYSYSHEFGYLGKKFVSPLANPYDFPVGDKALEMIQRHRKVNEDRWNG